MLSYFLKKRNVKRKGNKIEWHLFDGADDAFESQLKSALKDVGLPDDAIRYIDYVKELDL